jgi:4,5-DOPA dioxygenase extradiol
MMPIFFIGHGSPMNAIENNEFSRKWQALSKEIPTPKAILCASAHWLTQETSITSNEAPPTIHDFGGFPKQLFEVEYPAPGNKILAKEIAESIDGYNVKLDESWGLDHGTWSILKHIYPKANIPVLQLSIKNTPDGKYHFELGKKLRSLREKDILIIGSGNLVHNLGLVDWNKMHLPEYGFDWAIRANELFKSMIQGKKFDELVRYESLGTDIDKAIPTPEHYIPLLYILGASYQEDSIEIFNDKVIMGSLNMTSVRFG